MYLHDPILSFAESSIKLIHKLEIGVKLHSFSFQLPWVLSHMSDLWLSISAPGKKDLGLIILSIE